MCVCCCDGPCISCAGVGPSAALGHSQEGKSQTFELKMKAERRKGRKKWMEGVWRRVTKPEQRIDDGGGKAGPWTQKLQLRYVGRIT